MLFGFFSILLESMCIYGGIYPKPHHQELMPVLSHYSIQHCAGIHYKFPRSHKQRVETHINQGLLPSPPLPDAPQQNQIQVKIQSETLTQMDLSIPNLISEVSGSSMMNRKWRKSKGPASRMEPHYQAQSRPTAKGQGGRTCQTFCELNPRLSEPESISEK